MEKCIKKDSAYVFLKEIKQDGKMFRVYYIKPYAEELLVIEEIDTKGGNIGEIEIPYKMLGTISNTLLQEYLNLIDKIKFIL